MTTPTPWRRANQAVTVLRLKELRLGAEVANRRHAVSNARRQFEHGTELVVGRDEGIDGRDVCGEEVPRSGVQFEHKGRKEQELSGARTPRGFPKPDLDGMSEEDREAQDCDDRET